MEALPRKRWRHSKRTCLQLTMALGCRWGHCIIFRFFQKKVLVKASLKDLGWSVDIRSITSKESFPLREIIWIFGWELLNWTNHTARLYLHHYSTFTATDYPSYLYIYFFIRSSMNICTFPWAYLEVLKVYARKERLDLRRGHAPSKLLFFINLGAHKYHFLQFPQEIFSLNKYEGKCIN